MNDDDVEQDPFVEGAPLPYAEKPVISAYAEVCCKAKPFLEELVVQLAEAGPTGVNSIRNVAIASLARQMAELIDLAIEAEAS